MEFTSPKSAEQHWKNLIDDIQYNDQGQVKVNWVDISILLTFYNHKQVYIFKLFKNKNNLKGKNDTTKTDILCQLQSYSGNKIQKITYLVDRWFCLFWLNLCSQLAIIDPEWQTFPYTKVACICFRGTSSVGIGVHWHKLYLGQYQCYEDQNVLVS